jgi:hypothetical protein
MKKFSELNIKPDHQFLTGEKIKITKILNKPIIVHSFLVNNSKFDNKPGECLTLQIEVDGEKRILFSGSKVLISMINQVNKEDFPFQTTIVKEGETFEFR